MVAAAGRSPAALALALGAGLCLAACADSTGSGPAAAPGEDRLAPLREFEARRRATADFARLPPSDRALGPDPISLRRIPGSAWLASALRGRDQLVLLDAASLAELGRAPAPASPVGLAVTAGGEVLVAGEASPRIERYAAHSGGLTPAGALVLEGIHGLRDLAVGPEGVAYALDERAGALITVPLPAADVERGERVIPREDREEEPLCAAPFRVERLPHHLVVACLVDHALVVRRVGEDGHALAEGEVRIRHDGPIWGFAAAPLGDDELLIAAGGVEDHPLDRTGGFFGYIDSFVFLYRVNARAELLSAVNVSDLGVVTPKALAIDVDAAGAVRVTAAGYGGAARVDLRWPPGGRGARGVPTSEVRAIPPGVAALAQLDAGALAYADPLLDAWFLDRGGEIARAPSDVGDAGADAGAPPRSAASRLGEALFFTTLMAPWNTGQGALSRFTCETCHFEGTIDGRTHHTGRGEVRATTKPLLGLFNNRPHFSRALDPDLATMVDNEFRVAGAKSERDPWFSLSAAEVPWIREIGVGEGPFTPVELRAALMELLMDLTHRPNPAAQGRSRFTELERAGAGVFRDRCERCHAARLSADDQASAVPFDRWESLIFTREGPIVWGRDGYERTGVLPYVHERGARPPSLRRVSRKLPYFTNGSARSLREVLERARAGEGAFAHDGATAGAAPLAAHEVEALLGFLELL